MTMPKEPLLDEERERRDLDAALGFPYEKTYGCPLKGCGVPQEFKAIGHLLEAARAGPGFGVDVSLVCRDQARDLPGPYMATAYSPSGTTIGSPVITNRGPFVAVALAIIGASKSR
jgi:hypothetical protein